VTWTVWRLQRTETAIVGAILVLLAALLVPTGLHMASAYTHDGLAACSGPDQSYACGNAVGSFISRFGGLNNLINFFTLLPGLVGVALAAPFVLELENGTYRLAWTQSVTRGRWIAYKLGLPIAIAAAAAVAMSLLITWWREPFVHFNGRLDNGTYDSEGIVVIGYTLFALGLGVALGTLWRRAVAALVTAFVAYFVARIFVDSWLRQRLLTPRHTTWKASTLGPHLDHAWVLSQYPSDRLGHELPIVGNPCGGSHVGLAGGLSRCVAPNPTGWMHAVYLPASDFWPLQGAETAIFAGLALVLLGFAAWWTHERV
jgi:hypothetical protein